MFDPHASGGLLDSFPRCVAVRRSDPGGMAMSHSGQVTDPEVRFIPEPLGNSANPTQRFTSGLLAGHFQESPDLGTKAILGGPFFARVSKSSRRPPGATADPGDDGLAWEQPRSKPSRIELNLDLLKSDRGDRVAMRGVRAIEDRGRTGDEPGPDLRLVRIGAHHEK